MGFIVFSHLLFVAYYFLIIDKYYYFTQPLIFVNRFLGFFTFSFPQLFPGIY